MKWSSTLKVSYSIFGISFISIRPTKFLFDLTGVLVSGVEDFESSDDLYDAIGAILHEVSAEKSENDIKDLCEQLLCLMKPQDSTKKHSQKVLDAPINLAQMAANLQNNSHDVSSIWVINRDDNLVKYNVQFQIMKIIVQLLIGLPRVESRFEEIGKGTKEIGSEAG